MPHACAYRTTTHAHLPTRLIGYWLTKDSPVGSGQPAYTTFVDTTVPQPLMLQCSCFYGDLGHLLCAMCRLDQACRHTHLGELAERAPTVGVMLSRQDDFPI